MWLFFQRKLSSTNSLTTSSMAKKTSKSYRKSRISLRICLFQRPTDIKRQLNSWNCISKTSLKDLSSKSSSLNLFRMVRTWPDQSLSVQEEEAELQPWLILDRNMEMFPACKQCHVSPDYTINVYAHPDRFKFFHHAALCDGCPNSWRLKLSAVWIIEPVHTLLASYVTIATQAKLRFDSHWQGQSDLSYLLILPFLPVPVFAFLDVLFF